MDFGGGPGAGEHVHSHGRSLATLHGPRGNADVHIRLVAQTADVRLASGRTIEALTFNGRVPGPELRVHQGDLVEVTLANKDVDEGVSIHWHGVDLPNAEDGVSGVTQDRVLPGGSYVYRFRANVPGTYWYHSHRTRRARSRRTRSLRSAGGATFPRAARGADVVAIAHTIGGVNLLGSSDGEERRRVAPRPGRKASRDQHLEQPASLRPCRNFLPRRRDRRARQGRRRNVSGATHLGPRRRPLRPRLHDPADQPVRLACADRRSGCAGSGWRSVARGSVRRGLRPGDVRLACRVGAGTLRPAVRRQHRQAARLLRRRLRLDWQWTINGKAFPEMPMYMVRAGKRSSSGSRTTHTLRTRCISTATTCSCSRETGVR